MLFRSVGVMEDPNDETTFQLIATVQTHTPGFWEHFVLPLNTYDGTGKYLTFMVDGNDGTNKPQVVLVDQVQIDVIAACQPVSVIWSDSITSSSANIVWTGTDASYSVKVSSIAINPEITQGDVFDGVVSVTQLRLNNLVQHKNYYYYVKKIGRAHV